MGSLLPKRLNSITIETKKSRINLEDNGHDSENRGIKEGNLVIWRGKMRGVEGYIVVFIGSS